MKTIKKIFFILMLLLICLMPTVSAENAETSDILTNNSEISDLNTNQETNVPESIQENENVSLLNEIPTSGTFTDLNNALISANSGDTIYLTGDIVKTESEFSSFSTGIEVDKSITINGNGYSIDASHNGRIFNLHGYITLTLVNVSLINGNMIGSAGAINAYAVNTNIIINDNVHFINNTATSFAGAIYHYGSVTPGALIINGDNISFINNSGMSGTVIRTNVGFEITGSNIIFKNNSMSGASISLGSNSLTANNLVILEQHSFRNNNTVLSNLDYNYWGSVNPVADGYVNSAQINNWVIPVINGNRVIYENRTHNYIISFNQLNTGDSYDASNLADFNITIMVNNENTNYTVHDGYANFDFIPTTLGITNITVYDSTTRKELLRYSINVVPENSFTALYYQINGAVLNNVTLILDKDYEFNPNYDIDFVTGINVTNTVIIDGNGHSISGADSARIFNITEGSSLTLSNMTITDGNADIGGAIYAEENSNIIIDNIKFYNNTATINGDVIYNEGNGFISNSLFNNTQSTSDNLIYNNGNLSLNNNSMTSDKIIMIYNNVDLNHIPIINSTVNLVFYNSTTDYPNDLILSANLTDDNGNIIGGCNINAIWNISYQAILTNFSTSGVYYVSLNYTGYIYPGIFTLTGSVIGANSSKTKVQNGTITVNKMETLFNVNINDIDYGANLIINGTIISNMGNLVNGSVIISIDSQSYNVTVSNGSFNYEIPNLNPGNYTIEINFDGNQFLNPGNYTANITVNKLDSDFNASIDNNVSYGETGLINVELPENATGNITVIINNQTIVYNVGEDIVIPNLDAGNYTIEVIYSGDDIYNSSSTTVDYTVNPALVDVSVEVGDVIVGEDIVVNITIDFSGEIGGNASVIIKDENGDAVYETIVHIVDDFTSIPISVENAGNYTVDVKFSGDNFETVSETAEVIVNQALVDINFDVGESIVGEETIVNITMNSTIPIDGNISIVIKDNEGIIIYETNMTVNDDFTSISIPPINNTGNYMVDISFTGENFESVNETIELVVKPAPVDVLIDIGESIVGEETIVNITMNSTIPVNGNATLVVRDDKGNIIYRDNLTVINGFSSTSIPPLTDVGNYTIDVEFSGDNFETVSETAELVVNPATVDITVDVGNVTAGEDIIVNITVDSSINIDGNVSIVVKDDDENVVYETNVTVDEEFTSIIVPGINNTGDYTVDVEFSGDNFETVSETAELVVELALVDLNVDIDGIVVGEDIIVNITVDSIIPIDGNTSIVIKDSDGNIVYETNISITDEFTSIIIPGINSSGNYTIDVEFSGDNFETANTIVDLVVDPALVNITVDIGEAVVGEDIVVNITVNSTTIDPVEGDISITITDEEGDVVFETNESIDGKTTITVPGIEEPGEYEMEVNFTGDEVQDSKIFKNFTVISDYQLIGDNLTLYYHNGSAFVVQLIYEDVAAYGENIIISVNGINYTKTTNDDGFAYLTINLNPGVYEITAYFMDLSIVRTVTVLPTISADDLTKYFRNSSQYDVYVLDNNGNPKANATIQYNVNGVIYNRTSNSDGIARLNINLNPGHYVITATNLANGERISNNITVLPTLFVEDLVKYFRNDSQYEVFVLGPHGDPLENANVSININGVFYNRTTDVNGIAILNINLIPGHYIATVEDLNTGLKASSSVEVLSILIAQDLEMTYQDGSQYELTLLDGRGNPVENEVINLNINGMLYNKTTDSNGVARLDINLNPGKYIITAYYGLAAKSSFITIDNS